MTKYIAEIGLNHLGNSKLGMELVKGAVKSGVNGISMQIASPDYYDNSRPFRRKMNMIFYEKVVNFLKKKKINFGLAINDSETIKEFSSIKVDFWKILSYKFFDENLIKNLIKTKKKIYVSTGVASIKDIVKYSKKYRKINFIHTTLSNNISANTLAIHTIRKNVMNEVSFGLHSKEDEIIISAISLAADPIFFYIKKNDKRYYPDNIHALNIDELPKKIKLWKKINYSMGSGTKKKLSVPKWVFE